MTCGSIQVLTNENKTNAWFVSGCFGRSAIVDFVTGGYARLGWLKSEQRKKSNVRQLPQLEN